jgi:hypothetical protein
LPGVVHPGFPIGTIIKNKWKPHVAAVLLIESPLKLDRILSDAELLLYLRREFIPHSNLLSSVSGNVSKFRNMDDINNNSQISPELFENKTEEHLVSNSNKEGVTTLGFKIQGDIPVFLGVGNSVRNGINNLWPMEWRVRSIFQDTHRICG